MNVKRYIADNIQEAMIKIKTELGSDAIILHSRKIKQKGLRGFFKKNLVEVVAAIDEKEVIEKPEVKKVEKIIEPIIKEVVKPIVDENIENENIKDLQNEVDEIKTLLKALINNKDIIPNDKNVEESLDVDKDEIDSKVEISVLESEITKMLSELDINEKISKNIISIVKRQFSSSENNKEVIKSAIKQVVKEYIGEPFTIDHFLGDQRVFLFVGQTGVGKTTTLAKLAARLKLVEDKDVALITADTYRIAAVDQLKTYSDILGIPVSVIYEYDELKDVMYKYRNKDVILLDTAGRSHKSEDFSKDLTELLENIEKPEIFLVISLTTGYKDIISILDAYKFIDNYKLIFTKLDEASSFSNILNIKTESGKSLSYLTTGQSVPDDIEIADSERVANYIIGEIK